MQTHPFIISVPYKIAGIVSAAVGWVVGALLLYFYTQAGWMVACLDSLISVGLFAVCGFLLWFVTGVLRLVQVQVAVAILVQVLCLVGGYMVELLGCPGRIDTFVYTVPFRFLFGVLGWIILAQWYYARWLEQRQQEEEEEGNTSETELSPIPVESAEPELDRISVKDGSRIHLIQLDELLYIQASGDYVTLFTTNGQYVKDQTMKYFESRLPASTFIRIHRSCIVNCEYIARIELFGKETWQVRLKTGVSLRASAGGYKLLKERLSL